MKPHVTMLMQTSLDGRLDPSRWTASPDGDREQWSSAYERIHGALDGGAWIVGRVTMAEMSKSEAHPPADAGVVERPVHVAARDGDTLAVALDRSAKLHFDKGDVGGDPVVVLLGTGVPDSHLAELRDDGVSYIVAADDEFDLAALLATLHDRFGVQRLILEGGAGINGSFLADGLVDEVSLLVAPAFDGGTDVQGVVAFGDGLAGKLELSLQGADVIEHGLVHLRYAVSPGGGD